MRIPKLSSTTIRRRPRRTLLAGIAGAALLSLPVAAASPRVLETVAATDDPVLAVSGDIACAPGTTPTATRCQQGATGNVVAGIDPDFVLPLGDTQYENGTDAEYAGAYAKTVWGADKGISRPAAGNHEYRTTGAAPYHSYFGANAGDPAKGYYSWNVTGPGNAFSWHMIALNSECVQLGGGSITQGCGVGSSQEAWLKADLAANKNVCTIAYWHRPRFSSSTTTPSSTSYVAFWNDLYNAGADIVLNGHAHDYERFAPQTSAGAADPAKGLREFVVGTGGKDFHTMGAPIANSAAINTSAFGVLKLTLHASSYDWQFVAANGYQYNDTGSGTCHSAPPADTAPPSAPTAVTASAPDASQVNLSWTASTDNVGVKNYNIYRGANGATPTLVATTATNATSYSDTAVAASTSYTYQVQAMDAAGNLSQLSEAGSVRTPAVTDKTPPTVPTGLLSEEVSDHQVDIGWTGSTDTGTGVSGYKVYRKGPGEPDFTLLATTVGTGPGKTSHQDFTVKPDSTYQYQVSAYDGANNESGRSVPLSVTTPAGPSSRTFTFTPAGDATLDKASPTSNAGTATSLTADNSPVDDFLLKFNVATSGCASLSSATLRLTNNANGSTKGGDLYTTGPNWAESTVNWSTAPARGALLNSLGAVSSGAVATVDVTEGVTTLNGEVNLRVGNSVNDGVRYWSREAATTGNRPQLTVVCATSAPAPDTTAPAAPANLTAQPVSGSEVDLQWTGSTDNVGVTGYRIYRGGAVVGTVPGDALAYHDASDVKPSTSYSYTVTAVDAAGNESARSNSVTVTTPGGTGPKTFSFAPAGDATVDATNPTTNAGTSPKLVVDNSPVNGAMLKFAVATTGCASLTRATLRLTDNANGSVKGGDVYASGSGWSEGTVAYANAPARGTLLGSLGPVTSGATYTIDVTKGVSTLNGEVAFRVGSASGDGAHYYSKEGGTTAQKPQLTVVCSGG
jgi:fibronectin type 3 domain-containing protein